MINKHFLSSVPEHIHRGNEKWGFYLGLRLVQVAPAAFLPTLFIFFIDTMGVRINHMQFFLFKFIPFGRRKEYCDATLLFSYIRKIL